MANISGGLLTGGGLVSALGQATTYLFSWTGVVPTTPGGAVSLASLAPAYVTSTAYKLGNVIVGSDGRAYGCVTPGTSASTGTGPTDPALPGGPSIRLLCGGSLPTYTDGTAGWIALSNALGAAAPAQALFVTNRDATTNWLDLGMATGSTGLIAGAGAGVPPQGGTWKIDGGDAESIFAICAATLTPAFSVTVAV